MIDADTRLRVARGIAKSESEASVEAFEALKRRGHPATPPALLSDGHGGIREALVAVYGAVPEYRGVGRPPVRKQPSADWQYLQMVKQRDEHYRVVGVEMRAVYGDEAALVAHLGQSTAYVERTHLTMRHMSGRLVRKGLGFSKAVAMHRASAAWEDAAYNLTRPLKTLREEEVAARAVSAGGGVTAHRRWHQD